MFRIKRFGSRDHNATSYSTETSHRNTDQSHKGSRDHNATSYSTETDDFFLYEIGQYCRDHNATSYSTETERRSCEKRGSACRDHNATSYSTETSPCRRRRCRIPAEIITLRAIALKHDHNLSFDSDLRSRDHNATSYSTETVRKVKEAKALSQRS